MIRNSLLSNQLAPRIANDLETHGLTNRVAGSQAPSGGPETTNGTTNGAHALDEIAYRFDNYCLSLMEADASARAKVQAIILDMINHLAYSDARLEPDRVNAIRALLAELDQGWSSADLRDFSQDVAAARPDNSPGADRH